MKHEISRLVLPIKNKYFSMILKGIKQEEYREMKHYYTIRFLHLSGLGISEGEFIERLRHSSIQLPKIMLRNGYSSASPSVLIESSLHVGKGRQEWGAVEEVEYYVLDIQSVTRILFQLDEFPDDMIINEFIDKNICENRQIEKIKS